MGIYKLKKPLTTDDIKAKIYAAFDEVYQHGFGELRIKVATKENTKHVDIEPMKRSRYEIK